MSTDNPIRTIAELINRSSHCMAQDRQGNYHSAVKAKISDLQNIERELSAQWRPIETAPKDGTWILVYEPESNICIAHWGIPEWEGGERTWVTESLGPNPDNYCADDATHWQPLPPPPKS